MKKINLTQGKFALVDNEDFEYLNQFKWKFDATTGYSCRTLYPKGKEYMHRIINKTPRNMQTDHINRNKLDNRRENLRTVTAKLNVRNTGLFKTNKTGHKGIWFWETREKWQVYIWNNNKKVYLGIFNTLSEAIIARKDGERKYWI